VLPPVQNADLRFAIASCVNFLTKNGPSGRGSLISLEIIPLGKYKRKRIAQLNQI